MNTPRKGLATRLIHTAEGHQPGAVPLTTPIYETTTFVFDSTAELQAYIEGGSDSYFYSRYDNPSLHALEAKLAEAEDAEASMVFASGMGAIASTLLSLLSAGDEVVCSAAIYGGTLHLLQSFLARFGVTTRFVELDQLRDPTFVIGPATKVVWFESPINPTLRCLDIARVATACRAAGVLSVMDNTFATPFNQRPLTLGVDLVMHSVTKYLNGHSDVTAGAIMGSRALVAAARAGPQADWRVAGPGGGRARGTRPEDAGRAHGAPQRQRARTGARLRGRPAHQCGAVSRPGQPSRSRHRGRPDARLRRHGDPGPAGRLRRRGAVLRSHRACSSAPPAWAVSRACAACRC